VQILALQLENSPVHSLLLLLLVGVRISSNTGRENGTLEIQVELEDEVLVLKFSIAHTSKARCVDLNVQVEMLPHRNTTLFLGPVWTCC
jgi:hypothetical protein